MYPSILNNLYKWFLIPLTLSTQLCSSYASLEDTWHRNKAGCKIIQQAEANDLPDDVGKGNNMPPVACLGNKLHVLARTGSDTKVLSRYESGTGDPNKIVAEELKATWNRTTDTIYHTIDTITAGNTSRGQAWLVDTYPNIMHDLYYFVIEERFKDNYKLSKKLKELWNKKPMFNARRQITAGSTKTDSATHTEFVMIYDILPEEIKWCLDAAYYIFKQNHPDTKLGEALIQDGEKNSSRWKYRRTHDLLEKLRLCTRDKSKHDKICSEFTGELKDLYDITIHELKYNDLLPKLMSSSKAMCPVCEIFLTSLYELCGRDASFISKKNTYKSPDTKQNTRLKKVFLDALKPSAEGRGTSNTMQRKGDRDAHLNQTPVWGAPAVVPQSIMRPTTSTVDSKGVGTSTFNGSNPQNPPLVYNTLFPPLVHVQSHETLGNDLQQQEPPPTSTPNTGKDGTKESGRR